MARTPMMKWLRKLAADHAEADGRGISVEELHERRERERKSGQGLSRRELLAAGVAAGAVGLVPWKVAAKGGKPPPSGGGVAIIGGGISGLVTALTLQDAGVPCTIYEGHAWIGGRAKTDRPGNKAQGDYPGCGSCHGSIHPQSYDTWADQQFSDIYGEMIDSAHATMFSLANRFGMPPVDLEADRPAGHLETYYFNGSIYTQAQYEADFSKAIRQIQADLKAAGYPSTWNSSTARGRQLDAMSVRQYLDQYVVPISPRLATLFDLAYNVEYGAEASDQSSLNMLYMLGYSPAPPKQPNLQGEGDERWRIPGGTDRLIQAIYSTLVASGRPAAVTIDTGMTLRAIAQSGSKYALTFDRSTVLADMVVITVPFPALRAPNVDYARAGFDARKIAAIENVGASRNGKLFLQFNRRIWLDPPPNPWGAQSGGDAYADTGFQCTWEETRAQDWTPKGILLKYSGGDTAGGMAYGHYYDNCNGKLGSSAVYNEATKFLSQIEPVYPGITALWNGRAANALAHVDPLFKCSYTYWKPGQYCNPPAGRLAFVGYERVPQGNVYFAGDGTSLDFQGYLEGGASEGIRAANEVLKALGVR